MKQEKLLFIDTDPGVDDANALMLALASVEDKDAEVIAISTVAGNASAFQGAVNAYRVLKLFEQTEIPIFVGADLPLLNLSDDYGSQHLHGSEDGMGNRLDVYPTVCSDVVEKIQRLSQSEHAAHALVRYSRLYEGKLTLVCLAPMTNIALALKLDPMLRSRLKEVFIMGGACKSKGNATMTAEYNFYKDPEAAHVVLHEFSCPMTIVPWEVYREHLFNCDWFKQVAIMKKATMTLRGSFYVAINDYINELMRNHWQGDNSFCDESAMAIALDASYIIQSYDAPATVVTNGCWSRGQLLVDHWPESVYRSIDHWSIDVKPVRIVTQYDVVRLRRRFEYILSK